MNRTNAHSYAPLVIALGDGKTIQAHRLQADGSFAWEDLDDEVMFTCPADAYRVKPEAHAPILTGENTP